MRARVVLISLMVAGVFFTPSVRAEYRVFILQISDSTTGQSRTVTTTLDDLQYHEYYPIHPTEKVSIQETWMCRHTRSDISQDISQAYCANPHPAAALAPGTATSTGQNTGQNTGQSARQPASP